MSYEEQLEFYEDKQKCMLSQLGHSSKGDMLKLDCAMQSIYKLYIMGDCWLSG